MRPELKAIAKTPERRAYLDEIGRRTRSGVWAMRARYVSIHLSWIVVLVAGASVALVDVFDFSTRYAAVLGLVVVVFQGFERIFDRTSHGAQANDVLRRALEQEQRMVLGGIGPYADAVDPFNVFAGRCEALIADHDATMVDFFSSLTGGDDSG